MEIFAGILVIVILLLVTGTVGGIEAGTLTLNGTERRPTSTNSDQP